MASGMVVNSAPRTMVPRKASDKMAEEKRNPNVCRLRSSVGGP